MEREVILEFTEKRFNYCNQICLLGPRKGGKIDVGDVGGANRRRVSNAAHVRINFHTFCFDVVTQRQAVSINPSISIVVPDSLLAILSSFVEILYRFWNDVSASSEWIKSKRVNTFVLNPFRDTEMIFEGPLAFLKAL